jgi:hypothetical protein
MQPTKVKTTILTATGLITHTTEFYRSEDCGYRAGRLVGDLPDGRTVSIRKDGKAWIVATIHNGIGVRSESFGSKSAALNAIAVRAMEQAMCTD